MRTHQQQRESERPSSVDLLSKILRRGSHAADPTDDNSRSADAEQKPMAIDEHIIYGGRSRKSSHYQNNNNQQRPSVTGNSRFSAFFIDPLYHAIMMNKGKEDATASPGLGAHHVEELGKEEASRRQDLMLLRFEDLHLAFDPYSGAEPEDTMDNNELESLLEQKEEGRDTLEEKISVNSDSTGSSDVEDQFQSSQKNLQSHEQNLEHDDDGELDFDAPNIDVSVKRLMHRIQSMSGLPDDMDLSMKSNQDDEDSNDDEEEDTRDQDAESVSEITFEDLEPRMLETTVIPTYVPSCFPEAQMPLHLTASVRRLVIDLKDDSERRHEAPLQHGFSARRRGNSCPVPIRPPPAPLVLPASTSTTPTALAGSQDADSSRKRKKSSFGRLAPRLLETLNFRRKKKTFHYTDEELETIEGARWKIVELAFRFGGKHRFYLVQAINMFFPLVKYGRRGGPHPTRLHCNQCGTLQWQHKRSGLSSSVDLAQVLQVLDGRQTAVFRKYATSAALEARSFSIIFSDRTLDLETQSMSHRDWLMSALQTLISYAKTQREAEERAIAERRILPLDDPQQPVS